MAVHRVRPEVKSAKILGWSVYYPLGVVYRTARGAIPSDLPTSECQAVIVFTQGDTDLGQAPRKVYREALYGYGEDVVEFSVPGSSIRVRGSTLSARAFETIRASTDFDWEF